MTLRRRLSVIGAVGHDPVQGQEHDGTASKATLGGLQSGRVSSQLRTWMKKSIEKLTLQSLVNLLKGYGLSIDDERLATVKAYLTELGLENEPNHLITVVEMKQLRHLSGLVSRVIDGKLSIQNFSKFTQILSECFDIVEPNKEGNNADYIPSLAKVDPDQFGISVCSIDGQRYSKGDADTPFCVQSCSKPITYGIAQMLHGVEKVHTHVGKEASGRAFNSDIMDARNNESDLKAQRNKIRNANKIEDKEQREYELLRARSQAIRPPIPYNPCINAGAIMTSSLVWNDLDESERFENVMQIWSDLNGYNSSCSSPSLPRPVFGNATYLSERNTANRNRSLAYTMMNNGAFPDKTNLQFTLESYFMYCSIELTCASMAVVAGSLANGGVCPVTGKKVFTPEVVANILSVMQCSGMYDYSGKFQYTMGFPTKSGVGGSIFIVIPGVCGICTWSPRLDQFGNSVRGVEYCKYLAQRFTFHSFDFDNEHKMNPSTNLIMSASALENVFHVYWAAYLGDTSRLLQLLTREFDINVADYDGRTALHIAAAERQAEAVKILIDRGADHTLIDRNGDTPLQSWLRENGRVDTSDPVIMLLKEGRLGPCSLGSDAHFLASAFNTLEGETTKAVVSQYLIDMGICVSEHKAVADSLEHIKNGALTREHFASLAENDIIARTFQGSLVIPEWSTFSTIVRDIFNFINRDRSLMSLAELQMFKESPGDAFMQSQHPEDMDAPSSSGSGNASSSGTKFVASLSVCSIDGQTMSVGDSKRRFCVENIANIFTYAVATKTMGTDLVHEYVGKEPSGEKYDALILANPEDEEDENSHPMPHNPLIAAGAIMCAGIHCTKDGNVDESRMEEYRKFWGDMNGSEEAASIDEAAYKEERDNGDVYKCLSYMMQGANCFPKNVECMSALDAYLQNKKIEQNVEQLSVIAATLANNGVNPYTQKRVFSQDTNKNLLALMSSCGMSTWSGEVCFKYGFPCCSSLGSGALLIVVPQKFGACYFCPELNEASISEDALNFCDILAATFKVHIFSSLPGYCNEKIDVRSYKNAHMQTISCNLISAASRGDICACRSYIHYGGVACLNKGDYDGRTPLHLACADGHLDVVEMFLSIEGVLPSPRDRWGQTPMDDARTSNHADIVTCLMEFTSAADPIQLIKSRSLRSSTEHSNSLQDIISVLHTRSHSNSKGR